MPAAATSATTPPASRPARPASTFPDFIRKIATGNVKGAAVTILEENIFGGACARVCPTEILCERACVRMTRRGQAGQYRRAAALCHGSSVRTGRRSPSSAPPATGRRVAVVGGGPAGLACAHRLALLGHETVVFEARDKLGGLNEYGIAAYKVPDDFAQREVTSSWRSAASRSRTGKALGRDITLSALRRDFDAVFLGMGFAGVNALAAEGEDLAGRRGRGRLYRAAAPGRRTNRRCRSAGGSS